MIGGDIWGLGTAGREDAARRAPFDAEALRPDLPIATRWRRWFGSLLAARFQPRPSALWDDVQ